MRAGDGIAVGIGQLRYTAETTVLQELVDSLIIRCEAGIVAVGSEEVHHIGSLHNLRELAVFRTILQPVAHHLTSEGVEVFAVGLVRATGQHQ